VPPPRLGRSVFLRLGRSPLLPAGQLNPAWAAFRQPASAPVAPLHISLALVRRADSCWAGAVSFQAGLLHRQIAPGRQCLARTRSPTPRSPLAGTSTTGRLLHRPLRPRPVQPRPPASSAGWIDPGGIDPAGVTASSSTAPSTSLYTGLGTPLAQTSACCSQSYPQEEDETDD
jgi:hypothetical protein